MQPIFLGSSLIRHSTKDFSSYFMSIQGRKGILCGQEKADFEHSSFRWKSLPGEEDPDPPASEKPLQRKERKAMMRSGVKATSNLSTHVPSCNPLKKQTNKHLPIWPSGFWKHSLIPPEMSSNLGCAQTSLKGICLVFRATGVGRGPEEQGMAECWDRTAPEC